MFSTSQHTCVFLCCSLQNLTVHGIYWGSYMDRRPSVLRDSMAQLLRWLADGSIKIQVSHRVPIDKVSAPALACGWVRRSASPW